MRLVDTHRTRMDLKPDTLSERELAAANMIAEAMHDGVIEGPVGLFIWKICRGYGVNHKKIARHLGGRKKTRA